MLVCGVCEDLETWEEKTPHFPRFSHYLIFGLSGLVGGFFRQAIADRVVCAVGLRVAKKI